MRRSMLIQLLLLPMPWSIRRRALNRILGFEIHPQARIGLSIVAPVHLRMAPGSEIGHLNLIRGMELVEMATGCGISRLNWIYGTPYASEYLEGVERHSALILEEGAGMTARHLVDCTATVRFGRYAELVGYGTQILSHQIDPRTGKQTAAPVTIGAYAMIATRCNILSGTTLPDCSIVGAGSTVRGHLRGTHRLWSGVPAQPTGEPLSSELAWFTDEGHTAHGRVVASGRALITKIMGNTNHL